MIASKATAAAAAPRPGILIVGTGRRARRLKSHMEKLGLPYRALADPELFLAEPGSGVRLVLLAPPLPSLSAVDFCRRLRARIGNRIPVFVVGEANRKTRSLRRAGVTGQFALPREEPALIRTVLRLAGPLSRRWSTRKPEDVALKTRVEHRLDTTHRRLTHQLKVRVHRGVVRLAGVVGSRGKISELARSLTSMAGVDEVVTRDVRVWS